MVHLIDRKSKRYPKARTPEALEVPEKGNKVYYDGGHKDAVTGFGIRVTSAGARAFVLNYRFHGRERRYTIGQYPDWSVTAARDQAAKLKRKIADGHDPLAELQAERGAPTVSDLPKKRPSSQQGDQRAIDRLILPRLKHLKVNEVAFDDIDSLHRKITKDGSPYMANRVVALLSKMFNLAMKWNMRDRALGNPCQGVERNPEVKRKRYLRPDELARLMVALDEFPDQQAANIVRLLLLTGARFGEVAGARWEQFDLEAGKWIKPGATTKQKTEHEVPLSPEALELLAMLREKADADAEYVFPGRGGIGHRVDLKKPWPAICKAAAITGLRIHDLRHSYASLLVSSGASLPIVGAMLGHTQPSTTHRYAHLLDDPLRKAAKRVGRIVTDAGKAKAKVVKLRP